MDLQLPDVEQFVRIVALGTLSAAARERNVPVSQVTRSLARLEAACGVRLLHRSTHGLSLTDEGDTFLAYARRLLETTEELQTELSGKIGGPSGWVRVSMSPLIAQLVIAPSLNSLYERYPQLHVDLCADDRMADMAREGIDIALRTGTPNSETLVARQIGQYSRSLYASPAYLARRGVPSRLEDLDHHHLIASTYPVLNRWVTSGEAAEQGDLIVGGQTRTDNSSVILSLVREGVGIGRLMNLLVRPLLASGELVRVLPGQFDSPSVPIYAVMLQERHRLPKIRACIDHWADWLDAMARG
ncbi:MAG: LysR family transcriptional regulator [Burkholderiaceae bacterium]